MMKKLEIKAKQWGRRFYSVLIFPLLVFYNLLSIIMNYPIFIKRLIVSPPLPPHFLNRPLPPDSPEIIYPTPNKDALNEYKKQRKQRLDQQPNNVDLLCNTETHF
jgi:hypothetical protein